jgi:hypothetical protein
MDDQHRALGMVHRMVRYRPKSHSGEAAVAARSDHQEIGPGRRFQEDVGGMPLRHLTADRHPCF